MTDLLPGTFLFADQNTSNTNKPVTNENLDGSFERALNEMDYHRKRMNEYLCHGYMAEEIFKEVSTPRVKRRPESSPIANDNLHNFLGNDNVTIHDKLLSDEGSSKYKNWLQRTTTLDDIYRHYAPRKKIMKKQDGQHKDIEEFDGEVTGYAMQAPLPSGKVGFYEPSHEGDMLSSSSGHHNFHYGPAFGHHYGDHFGHHGDFFPSIHEEFYYVPQSHHDQEEDHGPVYDKGKSHDLSVKDFFEIALTALAFLAFGLFIIQLLMNANNNPPMMMTTGRQRAKRHAIPMSLSSASNEDLNDLSYRVLRSIEAVMVAETDSGNCLRRILCENNRYSRETNDGRRIWVPVWSLGMSWLSGRVLNRAPWSARLDSVKASILGLGGIDCASFYPGCNLEKEGIKRRRRKRK
ncbi:uncharacterized protein LOC116842365 [Odontomachus brunneus]|uniref:uncharacterized protein LOC116842365 n=1 Tax=Odontomachus brunneus TaxID=486640 RepID=UPI0013F1D0D1|nr:uncharacterized protein LOC116842365 [Odontomachus brunneus]